MGFPHARPMQGLRECGQACNPVVLPAIHEIVLLHADLSALEFGDDVGRLDHLAPTRSCKQTNSREMKQTAHQVAVLGFAGVLGVLLGLWVCWVCRVCRVCCWACVHSVAWQAR